MLSDPDTVLAEVEARQRDMDDQSSLERKLDQLSIQLDHLTKREQRIYRIYEFGGNEELLKADMKALHRDRHEMIAEKARLEQILAEINNVEDQRRGVESFCELVSRNLSYFTFDEKRLALEALRMWIWVDGDRISISGAIPIAQGAVGSTSSWWGR